MCRGIDIDIISLFLIQMDWSTNKRHGCLRLRKYALFLSYQRVYTSYTLIPNNEISVQALGFLSNGCTEYLPGHIMGFILYRLCPEMVPAVMLKRAIVVLCF